MQPDDASARVADRARDRDGLPRAIPTATTATRRGRARSPTSAATAPRRWRVLARACADGPDRRSPTRSTSPAGSTALEDALDGPGLGRRPSVDLAAELRGREGAARRVRRARHPDDPLAAEVAPWAAARPAAKRRPGLAALRLLQSVRPVAACRSGGPRPGGRPRPRGRPCTPRSWFSISGRPRVPMRRSCSVLDSRSTRRSSSCPTGGPRSTPGAAVREDAQRDRRLCRLALRDLRRRGGRAAAGAPLRVFVDGEERPVADGRAFDGRGRMVMVRRARCAPASRQ